MPHPLLYVATRVRRKIKFLAGKKMKRLQDVAEYETLEPKSYYSAHVRYGSSSGFINFNGKCMYSFEFQFVVCLLLASFSEILEVLGTPKTPCATPSTATPSTATPSTASPSTTPSAAVRKVPLLLLLWGFQPWTQGPLYIYIINQRCGFERVDHYKKGN